MEQTYKMLLLSLDEIKKQSQLKKEVYQSQWKRSSTSYMKNKESSLGLLSCPYTGQKSGSVRGSKFPDFQLENHSQSAAAIGATTNTVMAQPSWRAPDPVY